MSTMPDAVVGADDVATDEPPPFWISRVRIRDYRSIAFCDVTLEPLTILVGRNGAGKSNFLDALAFVGELASRDIRDVIDEHGGPDATVCRARGEVDRFSIAIDSRVADPVTQRVVVVRYRFDYSPRRRSWADRVEETVSIPDRGSTVTLRGGRIEGMSAAPNPGYSLLTVLVDPILVAFRRGLRGLHRYNIRPDAVRIARRRSAVSFLKPDGSNAATVYRQLKESGSWRYGRLLAYLENVVPQLRAVEPAGNESEDTLDFAWRSGESTGATAADDRPVRHFPASAMSDGTLRAFGILLAALQTDELGEDPSVILLEEPEAGLHPAAVRSIVAALDEASTRVQVILTTHSPGLLDTPEATPARTRVVSATDRGTEITVLDEAAVEVIGEHLNTPGGLEASDRLELDRDDRERQHRLSDIPEEAEPCPS